MRKIFFVMVALFFLASGCSMLVNVKEDIVKTIQKECQSQNDCVIKIPSLTGFTWDKMIIFNERASMQEINNTLGFKYNGDSDLLNVTIFLYKGKIVHQEVEQIAVEKPNDLTIEYPNGVNHLVFTPQNAVFRGRTYQLDGKTYYKIKPLRSSIK